MSATSRTRIKIIVNKLGEAEGELVNFLAPRTVNAILKSLPFEGKSAVWKEEVYFPIPMKVGSEKPKARVEKGTLAYWPLGAALCIFFGNSQPYSPVNVVGRVIRNLELFRSVRQGTLIRIEKI